MGDPSAQPFWPNDERTSVAIHLFFCVVGGSGGRFAGGWGSRSATRDAPMRGVGGAAAIAGAQQPDVLRRLLV
jgi:hypothetical protein